MWVPSPGEDQLRFGEHCSSSRSGQSLQTQGVVLASFSTELSRGAVTHSKTVCLLGVVGVEVVIVVIIKGMLRGLEHPRKGLVQKEPQGWALCILLQLHALAASWASSSPSLELLEDALSSSRVKGDH